IVTLSGDAPAKPGNYQVRIGMMFSDFINMVGGFKEDPVKLIAGGPMMGPTMFTLDVPIVKTSSAITAFTAKMAQMPPERNCIRCGKCVSACPMGLMPITLNSDVLAGDDEAFEKNNGLDCIECGSCSYVCPAKRHLAQSIRTKKRAVMAAKRKK
ncbi:MAG: SLBB domain-containing protein, partial [Firmicutes bacterium]|nr:SLBB domain-containing protein [Bacillota bacterium]